MGRQRTKEQLDAMSEADKEADILKALKEEGSIRLGSHRQIEFWGDAVGQLVDKGIAKVEDIGSDEAQWTCYEVTLLRGARKAAQPEPAPKEQPVEVPEHQHVWLRWVGDGSVDRQRCIKCEAFKDEL
jgi:hypothetical protein